MEIPLYVPMPHLRVTLPQLIADLAKLNHSCEAIAQATGEELTLKFPEGPLLLPKGRVNLHGIN